jgi:hypothetical protein
MRHLIWLFGIGMLSRSVSACENEPETAQHESPVWQISSNISAMPSQSRDLLPETGWELDPVFTATDELEFGAFSGCVSNLPRLEDGLVEFDTGLCPGYSVRVPMTDRVEAGESIELVVAHTILFSEIPAAGRMIVRVDDEEVWRWEKSIPEPADAATIQFVATRDIAAGTWLSIHVSNHGANNWRLVQMRAWTP